MQRRILVNYRLRPEAVAAMLPPPFRPHLVHGHGIAGICLIRLGHVRPAGLPPALGITTENAAHRIAVEWDTADGPVTGVYIPRRDTSSPMAVLLGGRAFPGWQHRAAFTVEEGAGAYRIEVSSRDRRVAITVAAQETDAMVAGSVFASVDDASAFFRCAPVGYACTPAAGVFDGVALATHGWTMAPLQLDEVRSSMFDGIGVPDSAFLMAGVDTTWRPQPQLLAAR
jgi:hypothetical protein